MEGPNGAAALAAILSCKDPDAQDEKLKDVLLVDV
jgi:hypothetical protein